MMPTNILVAAGNEPASDVAAFKKRPKSAESLENDATYQRLKRARLKIELMLLPARILTPEEEQKKKEKRERKTRLERKRNKDKRAVAKALAAQMQLLQLQLEEVQLATSPFLPVERVDLVYSCINQATGSLGGNGSGGPINGELTMGSMQKVINVLVSLCDLTPKSRFLDVGSGRGKPNLHVAQAQAVRLSVGIETEVIRYRLSMANLNLVLRHAHDAPATVPETLHGNTYFLHSDIMAARTMDPFTHVYMFDVGFPPELHLHIAVKFNGSAYANWLVSCQRPATLLDYGYKVELVSQIGTSMHGSGETHTIYFYRRLPREHCAPSKTAKSRLLLPARDASEEHIDVLCDPCFVEAVKVAISPVACIRERVGEMLKSLARMVRRSQGSA